MMDGDMTTLFEPVKLKNIVVRNRFVMSATGNHTADEQGHITDAQIETLTKIAEGGVGLIITGATYTHLSGKPFPSMNSISDDHCIPAYKKLTSAVHERGAKIVIQLFHPGKGSAKNLNSIDQEALAPSFIPNDPYFESSRLAGRYRSMKEDEIMEIVCSFGDASRRAREAGFDGVQIHETHGTLHSQFLSPYSNLRKDSWGGSLENRLRIHYETYKDIMLKVGQDYLILIKFGVQDGFAGGFKLEEGQQAAALLARQGYDALEISVGLRGEGYEEGEAWTEITSIEKEGYFRDWCREIKKQVQVPVMMVGGLRSIQLIEEIIDRGEADFVSLCRPLIREPNLINKWKAGGREKAKCISCNKCLETLITVGKLECIFAHKDKKSESENE
jgi:2,4-dienoyl-CoA reductase-like NADH-dependent reductase (Old Yellow Enzyme family)